MDKVLVAVLLGGLLYVAGQYVASEPNRVQQETEAGREISVTGQGKVSVRPDVAEIMVGVATGPQPNAERALSLLTERFSAVAEAIQDAGVEEKDITTSNLSIAPLYDFRDGQQVLRGFEASESVQVKIRDLDNVGEIVTAATSQGANQVGGINFTVDDRDALLAEAEEAAIEDAQAKAERLADALGAGLGKIKSYSSSPSSQPPIFAERNLAQGFPADAGGEKLPVPSGESDIETSVVIVYELR